MQHHLLTRNVAGNASSYAEWCPALSRKSPSAMISYSRIRLWWKIQIIHQLSFRVWISFRIFSIGHFFPQLTFVDVCLLPFWASPKPCLRQPPRRSSAKSPISSSDRDRQSVCSIRGSTTPNYISHQMPKQYWRRKLRRHN